MTTQNDNIWHGAYKIPWDDPDFSRRMLVEHLTQDHDMASRRAEWIDRQAAWIHDHLLDGKPASISHNIISGLLREELGFQGLILTDALTMHALDNVENVSTQCIKAGADINIKDIKGYTAMMYAEGKGNTEITELLKNIVKNN